jgi:hypothetical protein
MSSIVVYYEDQAVGGAIQEFQPHNLVCGCVADRLGWSVFDVRDRLRGEPKKGRDKLLAACHRMAISPGWNVDVVAIYDADRVAAAVGLTRGTDDAVVLAELRRRAPSPRIHPFLLHERIETVVDAAAACLGWQPPPPLPKDIMLRDRVLKHAAFSRTRTPRDCVLDAVPSLRDIVEFLAALLVDQALVYQSSR